MAYCLALFTMITKWAVQAPTIFLLSQLNFYLANSPAEKSEVFGVIVLNTVMPVILLCVAYSM